MAAIRQLYSNAVAAAESAWESAVTEGMPDMPAALQAVDGLAEAVTQNRTALVALTAMKNYDNYTFTHMVNVSILTMGQARALGIEGRLLREFGLSALMHDIGKVRTPEILNKTDKLTDQEFAIMKRHTVDGAEILRRTPEMPILAPVVAFEHHLRLDGTGYPLGVRRAALNLGTMLCSISDIYDAMRSQRAYQQAFPTERIIAVLKRNDGTQFDQHLVRRFVQLLGIYPPGNLVRLNTGESRSWRVCTRRIPTGPGCASCSTARDAARSALRTESLGAGSRRRRARQRRLAGGSRRIRDRSVELPAGVTAIMSEASHTPSRRALPRRRLHVAGAAHGGDPGLLARSPRRRAAPRASRGAAAGGLRRRIPRFAATHENVPGAGLDVALALGFGLVAASTIVRDPRQALTMVCAGVRRARGRRRPSSWRPADGVVPRWYSVGCAIFNVHIGAVAYLADAPALNAFLPPADGLVQHASGADVLRSERSSLIALNSSCAKVA